MARGGTNGDAGAPAAELAFIGGSSTYAADAADLLPPEAELLDKGLTFETPYGASPAFSLIRLGDDRRVLHCKMHGWREGTTRADASRQVFWVLREAGVARVLSEGGVGTIREDLAPRDLIIPDDYLDWSLRKDVSLGTPSLLIMRNPICPEISGILADKAAGLCPERRVERGGVYAVTDGRHFESRAEVRALRLLGADVVGQSLCPETYLAREIGACYGSVYLIVNRAEGVGEDWRHEELTEIFEEQPQVVGGIVFSALKALPADRSCGCPDLRKGTLLK